MLSALRRQIAGDIHCRIADANDKHAGVVVDLLV
jgi:hypothetical protein